MPGKVDYAELYQDAVRVAARDWERYVERLYPERRNCMLSVQAKAQQILAEIGQLQLKLGDPGPQDFIGNKVGELNLYAKACIHEEPPQDVDKAIDTLDKAIIMKTTSFGLENQVADWNRRLMQAGTKKAGDCRLPVRGKARELMDQLKQMKDTPPNDLVRVSMKGMQYLDNYAHRCLQDGVEVLPSDLPPDLRAERSQTAPSQRPHPFTQMPE